MVKALGEMGRDFYKEYSDRKRQEEVFRRQIAIARELGLPIVVHSKGCRRGNYQDLEGRKGL